VVNLILQLENLPLENLLFWPVFTNETTMEFRWKPIGSSRNHLPV
tara:strand:- start:40 stop:174 length:135 start_codon:yes stop_codon:yes gene_type:complete